MKICATCFEISICLFRVVEMVVSIAPDLFIDSSKPSADLLLNRLIQVCVIHVLTLNLIETPFYTFANRASPDQVATCSGSTLFAIKI